MKNLVSVIIPSYNHEKYIEKCIMSVINQTYKNLEILVMDDNSKDNSAKILKNIKDSRLKVYYSNKNKGIVRTINELTKKCKGKYVAIIGSDDIWKKNKISKQISYLEKNPEIGAVFTAAEIIDENGKLYENDEFFSDNVFCNNNMTRGKRMKLFFEKGNHLCHSSSVIRMSVIKNIGLYDMAYRQLHDYEYWVRLINEYDIYILNEKLVKYRRFKNSEQNLSNNSFESIIRVINENNSIISWMFDNIKKEIFIEGFSNMFVNKNSNSAIELLCEKYFILLNYKILDVVNKQLAYSLIYNYKNKEKIFDVFEKKYNYTLNDFYNNTGKTYDVFNFKYIYDCSSDNGKIIIENSKKIAEQEKKIIVYEDKINVLESNLDMLKRSLSWKITKPLRKIKGMIRSEKN